MHSLSEEDGENCSNRLSGGTYRSRNDFRHPDARNARTEPSRGDLKKHSVVHENIKPHECAEYGYRTKLKGNLTRHVATLELSARSDMRALSARSRRTTSTSWPSICTDTTRDRVSREDGDPHTIGRTFGVRNDLVRYYFQYVHKRIVGFDGPVSQRV